MEIIEITEKQKDEYNKVVNHPLQSFEWGEFREKTGVKKVIRRGITDNGKLIDGFTVTIHGIPHSKNNIGYLPKGGLPTKVVLEELKKIGKENNCIFIQLEPEIELENRKSKMDDLISSSQFLILKSFHPHFTKYTFTLDLTKSEEELLRAMHPKTRYNIKVAQKHNVQVKEDDSTESFQEYLKLSEETTKRQKFYAHSKKYHELMWKTLSIGNLKFEIGNSKNNLTAHLFVANYKPENQKPLTLTSWVLFIFHDTLYYPYGASSTKFRNVMASNLIMWEVIKYGKKLGLKKFDMWGALDPNPDPNNPWYGFHKFKQGYGTTLIEFEGSYDLVINPLFYNFYKFAEKSRWLFLKLKKRFF